MNEYEKTVHHSETDAALDLVSHLNADSKKRFFYHVYCHDCDRNANFYTLSDKIARQTACFLLDRSNFCPTVG
jgi:hypothetical protein